MSHLFDYPGWGSTVTIARNPPPVISGGPSGREGELTFLISPLTEIGPFLTHVQGEIESVPILGGGTIDRRVPLIHPDDGGMFIESYSLEYFGKPKSAAWVSGMSIHTEQFDHARMRAFFRTLPPGVGFELQFYNLDVETGATVETIPGGAMVTESGRELTGEFGITVPNTNLVLTTYMSPYPIPYAIHQMVGKVNSDIFTDPEIGDFPIGTLRFQGVRQSSTRGTSGRTLQKSFNLGYREEPWNKVINDLGDWEYAESVGSGRSKYASDDLNLLKLA